MTKKFHLQICLHEQSWESNMKKISTMLNEMLMWEIQCRFGHNSTAGPTSPLLAYYTVTQNCKISNDLPRLVWKKNFPTHPRLGYYTASVIFIFTAIIAKELSSPSSLHCCRPCFQVVIRDVLMMLPGSVQLTCIRISTSLLSISSSE